MRGFLASTDKRIRKSISCSPHRRLQLSWLIPTFRIQTSFFRYRSEWVRGSARKALVATASTHSAEQTHVTPCPDADGQMRRGVGGRFHQKRAGQYRASELKVAGTRSWRGQQPYDDAIATIPAYRRILNSMSLEARTAALLNLFEADPRYECARNFTKQMVFHFPITLALYVEYAWGIAPQKSW